MVELLFIALFRQVYPLFDIDTNLSLSLSLSLSSKTRR